MRATINKIPFLLLFNSREEVQEFNEDFIIVNDEKINIKKANQTLVLILKYLPYALVFMMFDYALIMGNLRDFIVSILILGFFSLILNYSKKIFIISLIIFSILNSVLIFNFNIQNSLENITMFLLFLILTSLLFIDIYYQKYKGYYYLHNSKTTLKTTIAKKHNKPLFFNKFKIKRGLNLNIEFPVYGYFARLEK